jgi:hypothetical protein
MDTSIHPWLEERFGQEIVLIALIDDATSRLSARFFPRDTGAANRQMIVDYLRAHGRMGSLYTDRASHFQANWRANERKEADEPEALTLIRRALDALEAMHLRRDRHCRCGAGPVIAPAPAPVSYPVLIRQTRN